MRRWSHWPALCGACDNTLRTEPSEAYSLEDDINEQADSLVEVVKERFHDWIESIDISQAQKKTRFSKGDSFLSFNYTSTIQAIYGVDPVDILHIHGRADAYDDLIFGHGETMEEESELDENGDSNRTMFSDAEGAAKYPFYALQKPVSETINANIKFFDSLEGFSTINVIGHSLNDIDLPYFEEIARNAKYAGWRVYCYKIEDQPWISLDDFVSSTYMSLGEDSSLAAGKPWFVSLPPTK